MIMKFKENDIITQDTLFCGHKYWVIQKVLRSKIHNYYYIIYPYSYNGKLFRSFIPQREIDWNLLSRQDYPELYI